MGLYGGTRVTYTPQPQDNTWSEFLNSQFEYQKSQDARAEQDRADAKAEEDARKASAAAGYPGLLNTVKQQIAQGLISYESGIEQLSDFATEHGLSQPYDDISKITQKHLATVPRKRAIGISATYEGLLGRQPTAKELRKGQKRFQAGTYTSMEDFEDSLTKSQEYQTKFNRSYLENYYDTQFGEAIVDKKGNKTKNRTFKFDPKLLPTYGGNLADRTKITTPDFGDEFVGTPEELQAQQQNIRDTRQYLYSAGLTNLQGEIDTNIQKLKKESAKEVAAIGSTGNVYSNLVSGFWS
jgi:hypothetical protein